MLVVQRIWKSFLKMPLPLSGFYIVGFGKSLRLLVVGDRAQWDVLHVTQLGL